MLSFCEFAFSGAHGMQSFCLIYRPFHNVCLLSIGWIFCAEIRLFWHSLSTMLKCDGIRFPKMVCGQPVCVCQLNWLISSKYSSISNKWHFPLIEHLLYIPTSHLCFQTFPMLNYSLQTLSSFSENSHTYRHLPHTHTHVRENVPISLWLSS